jgi:hypothetical protein
MRVRGQRSEAGSQKSEAGGLRTTIVVLIGAVLLWGAGGQNPRLASFRLPASTLHSPQSTSHSPLPPPPLVSYTTVVLGGFRGIVADLLWLRAAGLQDEGRYFELVQLADWITTLEPQFAEIWALHAWNMAYNISVMMPDKTARWRWVQNGIRLLRDRGQRYCPSDPLIHHELGLIFLHKIGSDTDSAAPYYRMQLIRQMAPLLGPDGRLAARLPTGGEIRERLAAIGLDYDAMREVDKRYGPLDWRVAEAHALYWADLGTKVPRPGAPDARCRRMVYHAMMALFDHGRLTHDTDSDLFVASPEFDLLPDVLATFERAIAESPDLQPEIPFASFLGSAVRTSHFYHRKEEAKQLFDMLHSRFPSRATQRGFDIFARGGGPRLPQILTVSEEEE